MKKKLNEKLLSLYLFIFSTSKLLIRGNENNSFIILLAPTILILTTSFIYNIKNKRRITINTTFIKVSLGILLLFLLSIILNNNETLKTYLYEFIIYGLITLYLYSKIDRIKEFIKYSAYLSIISFILYFSDPFRDYYYFVDYMSFGLFCMLPIFSFNCLARHYYNNKLFLITEILSIIEIAFFCNRGAFLAAVIIEIALFVISNKGKKESAKRIIKIAVIVVFVLILNFNLGRILSMVSTFQQDSKIYSYSMRAYEQMVSHESNGLSGRDTIWASSIDYFKSSPIIGHGIGSFETYYGRYSHNIFLELLNSFGIIGLLLFVYTIVRYVNKIKDSNEEKYIYITLLILGVCPLLFSLYSYKWPYYWIVMFIALNKNNKKTLPGKNNEKKKD